MVTTIGNFNGTNPETQSIINYMSGKRTAKQIVGEYFGLREEAIYDDNGETLIDYINEFKDLKMLKFKKVKYTDRLNEMGVTIEMFNKLFPQGLPQEEIKAEVEKEILPTNIVENGNEQPSNTGNIRKTKKK